MPMYYPDLKSVQMTAQAMSEQPDPAKRYRGIVPNTEAELSQARRQLGRYFREVWGDPIAAIEVEEALTSENYHEKLQAAFGRRYCAKREG